MGWLSTIMTLVCVAWIVVAFAAIMYKENRENQQPLDDWRAVAFVVLTLPALCITGAIGVACTVAGYNYPKKRR